MRTPGLTLLVFCGACASVSAPPEADEVAFAAAMLARPEATHTTGRRSATEALRPPPATWGPEDEVRGLLRANPDRLSELRRAAATGVDGLLGLPLPLADLEALAWLRASTVREARARLEAVRTGYAQSADLGDLVALYRSFVRDTATRVGPERSRRSAGRIAPSPNVDALSAEVVRRSVAIAREDLRKAIRNAVAESRRLHTDALRLEAARRILREDVALHEALLAVLRARFEAGLESQAGLLAFRARLEALQTELEILDAETTVVRARWNGLLGRPAAAPLALPTGSAEPEPHAPEADLIVRALEERQELRGARLAAERAELALRLGETMTLPRMDLGSSRLERERAGEAGVQRGAVFPEPGRPPMPRADFGVREAQLAELRARRDGARHTVAALRDATHAEVSGAVFAVDAAARRRRVHEEELIPLARRALESVRGSYEGSRAGYIELLESARGLLRARLGTIDARRAHGHALASLLEAVGVRPHLER